jgi:hypothetical protein
MHCALPVTHVKYVMCIGDSWLTGFNAEDPPLNMLDLASFVTTSLQSIKGAPPEDRGLSFACGDGRGTDVNGSTLATLLKERGSNVSGASYGKSLRGASLLDCRNCGLNGAVSAGSLLSYMSEEKSSTNKDHSGMTFVRQASLVRHQFEAQRFDKSAWKVMTISGGYASWVVLQNREINVDVLTRELDAMMQEIAKMAPVYVNFVLPPDQLRMSGICSAYLNTELFLIGRPQFTRDFAFLSKEYSAALYATKRKYDNRSRGIVVRLQPLLRNITLNERTTDRLSCYHPTSVQTTFMARSLMQNMLECDDAEKWIRPSTRDIPTSSCLC